MVGANSSTSLYAPLQTWERLSATRMVGANSSAPLTTSLQPWQWLSTTRMVGANSSTPSLYRSNHGNSPWQEFAPATFPDFILHAAAYLPISTARSS